MKLTEAEKEFVLRERERLELESRDWSKEPFVTDLQLIKMSAHFRQRFYDAPLIWRRSECCFAYMNATHPENEKWCAAMDAAKVVEGYFGS